MKDYEYDKLVQLREKYAKKLLPSMMKEINDSINTARQLVGLIEDITPAIPKKKTYDVFWREPVIKKIYREQADRQINIWLKYRQMVIKWELEFTAKEATPSSFFN